MSNEGYPNRKIRDRVNRGLAYVGLAAATSGVMAGNALARPSNAQSREAAVAHIDKKGRKPTPYEKNYWKETKAAMTAAIEKANKDKKPNLFYGAIYIPTMTAKVNGKWKTCVHGSPNKYLRGRTSVSFIYESILFDPVIEEINGRLYALPYNNGNIKNYVHPTGGNTATPPNASLKYSDVQKHFFIDLGECLRINHGVLGYYQHGQTEPRMLHSAVDNYFHSRGIAEDANKYPSTFPDAFLYGFDEYENYNPGNPMTMGKFMSNHGMMMLGPDYKPPFYEKMLAMSKKNTLTS